METENEGQWASSGRDMLLKRIATYILRSRNSESTGARKIEDPRSLNWAGERRSRQ